jgi:hypothetical protein
MGIEDLARVLGHAAMNESFLEELHNDPQKAAESLGVSLSKKEVNILEEELGKAGKHFEDFKQLHKKLNITYNKPR